MYVPMCMYPCTFGREKAQVKAQSKRTQHNTESRSQFMRVDNKERGTFDQWGATTRIDDVAKKDFSKSRPKHPTDSNSLLIPILIFSPSLLISLSPFLFTPHNANLPLSLSTLSLDRASLSTGPTGKTRWPDSSGSDRFRAILTASDRFLQVLAMKGGRSKAEPKKAESK